MTFTKAILLTVLCFLIGTVFNVTIAFASLFFAGYALFVPVLVGYALMTLYFQLRDRHGQKKH
jgi:hypothetical protein